MLREVVVEITWWVWIDSTSAELIRDKASLHMLDFNSNDIHANKVSIIHLSP